MTIEQASSMMCGKRFPVRPSAAAYRTTVGMAVVVALSLFAGPLRAQTPQARECDRLAASPYDSQKAATGVGWDNMEETRAMTACAAAMKAFPDTKRFQFQFGRAAQKAHHFDEALKVFQPLAKDGYAAARNNLGYMYYSGDGVPRDSARAVELFREAAQQGYIPAQNNLGYAYANGIGVSQDYARALDWYGRAAEKGNANAQYNLGYMYFRGLGVAADYKEAIRWYRSAAKQGNVDAQFNLGYMYQSGKGTPRDYRQAYFWYGMAAAQGDQDAAKARDGLVRQLTPGQIREAQAKIHRSSTVAAAEPKAVPQSSGLETASGKDEPAAPAKKMAEAPKAQSHSARTASAQPKPQATKPQQLASRTPAATKPSAKTADIAKRASPSAGGFGIQLAATRTPKAAQAEEKRMRLRYKTLLEDLSFRVVRADLGGKKGVFYRLRAPVGSRTAAQSLCQQLASKGQGCLVVRLKAAE